MRILVIDDEPGIRELLRDMLETEGHVVCEAADGAMALRRWREHSAEEAIDLIITDMLMPEKDGIEVIREIRQLAPKTKVIAISGGSPLMNIKLLEIANRLGAIRTIAKPFSLETLLNTVRSAFDENHATGTFKSALVEAAP
jgi:CheY-like chemotaxis protein